MQCACSANAIWSLGTKASATADWNTGIDHDTTILEEADDPSTVGELVHVS
jgi:hypothetical protein